MKQMRLILSTLFLSGFVIRRTLSLSLGGGGSSPSSSIMRNTAAAYDLVVIGGGSAGLTAAKLAATFDKSVVIIEKDRMGGVRYYCY